MKTLLLLRHGQTDGSGVLKGKSDIRLNEDGRRTMALAGMILNRQGFVPDVILSSTILRAIESAALLNEIQAPQYVMPAFDELDVGALEGSAGGMDLDTYDQHAAANHAETSDQALSRALEGIEMLQELPSKTGLAVSHSILMMLLYNALPKAQGLPEMIPFCNGSGFFIRLDGQAEITGLFPEN